MGKADSRTDVEWRGKMTNGGYVCIYVLHVTVCVPVQTKGSSYEPLKTFNPEGLASLINYLLNVSYNELSKAY